MKGQRPRSGAMIAALATTLAVTACGGSSNSSGSGASTGSSGKPLTIGISLSASGDFSDPGNAAKRGYQLWADTVNAHGGVLGRKVKLKIVDDASSPNQVVTNYQNLITRDKVDLVFGPFSTLLTAPAGKVVDRYGYAFPEPAGGGPSVFAEKLHNTFFVQPCAGHRLRRSVRELAQDAAARSAAQDRGVPDARRPVRGADRRRARARCSRRWASRRCSAPSTRPRRRI